MTILSTADVRGVEFTERRKGFDPEEIAAFTDDVCETIAHQKDLITAADERIAELEAKVSEVANVANEEGAEIEDLRTKVAELEAALLAEKTENEAALEQAATALATAQANQASMQARLDEVGENTGVTESVDLLTSAHKTAEDVIARANAAAEETTAKADEYYDDMVSAAATELAETKAAADSVRTAAEEYRAQALSVLRSATEFLQGAEAVEASEIVVDEVIEETVIFEPEEDAPAAEETEVVEDSKEDNFSFEL